MFDIESWYSLHMTQMRKFFGLFGWDRVRYELTSASDLETWRGKFIKEGKEGIV